VPLYEFTCNACAHTFEELARMGSTGEGLNCPSCGKSPVTKRMSTFYGRSSSGNGSYQEVAGSGCNCGGNCGSCGDACTCHH